MGVLIAIEPTMYREVLTGALVLLRSDVCVSACRSADLEREVARLRPELACCMRATDVVRDHVPLWVEFRFRSAGLDATVGGRGRAKEVSGMDLEDLLALIDGEVGLSAVT